jgi:transcriptional regulator with XRE-family HTH domain
MNRSGRQNGEEIRRLRKARGLSVPQLAQMIRVTPQSLSNIELGNKGASLEILMRIAEVLGVPIDWLVRKEIPARQEVPAGRSGAAA